MDKEKWLPPKGRVIYIKDGGIELLYDHTADKIDYGIVKTPYGESKPFPIASILAQGYWEVAPGWDK